MSEYLRQHSAIQLAGKNLQLKLGSSANYESDQASHISHFWTLLHLILKLGDDSVLSREGRQRARAFATILAAADLAAHFPSDQVAIITSPDFDINAFLLEQKRNDVLNEALRRGMEYLEQIKVIEVEVTDSDLKWPKELQEIVFANFRHVLIQVG